MPTASPNRRIAAWHSIAERWGCALALPFPRRLPEDATSARHQCCQPDDKMQ
jgi:hypothetical protein